MAQEPSYEPLQVKLQEVKEELRHCRAKRDFYRQNSTTLLRIFQWISIPILVIDKNHTITHCNRAYEKFKGVSARDLVGTDKHWLTFYSTKKPVILDYIVDEKSEAEILSYFGPECRKSPIAEGAYEAELFFPSQGENGKWFFLTAAPLLDKDGKVIGAIETFRDVTKRRTAEEEIRLSERRFRTLLNFVPYPISVVSRKGEVAYVNPGFTKTFGWTLEELKGNLIPFVPPDKRFETMQYMKKLFKDKVLLRHESKRMTKEGRVLDVVIRASFFSVDRSKEAGILSIYRDNTSEKRNARINEAVLRISTALPKYPDLEKLLDYINSEVKTLLDTEACVVMLHDQAKDEIFVLGGAYDENSSLRRVKEIRFTMDQLIAGRVIQTGQPAIVNDTAIDTELHRERDKKLGHQTRNLLLAPLQGRDRIFGVLCAINKKKGDFEAADLDLLKIISGTVALSVENARVTVALKKAYEEVKSMNSAKDKVINHLSHELKTPVAILSGSIDILMRILAEVPKQRWENNIARIQRNLDRIKDIQYEAQDIMEDRQLRTYGLLSLMLDQCADELQTLIEKRVGDSTVIQEVRKDIEAIFGTKEVTPQRLYLAEETGRRLKALEPMFAHRDIEILTRLEDTPPIFIPRDALHKIIDGLVKNAIENTPDEGRIEVIVRKELEGTSLLVHDYGVGIKDDAKKRIFEGFFTTQDTMDYSSKRPFDFNAGGKGADLLRMKIFSERYNFQITMTSLRCRFLLDEKYACPGRISACRYCNAKQDCHDSGGTIFSLYFPPAPERE